MLIVGAGTMGRQIGLQCAIFGYETILHDSSEDALSKANGGIQGIGSRLVKAGEITETNLSEALKRITVSYDLADAARDADFVSESVPENPELKIQVFSALNEMCPEETIFTTNSSSLLPSTLATGTGRPDRFCSMHFHIPVWDSNVVDIMPHPGASDATLKTVEAFARSVRQIPVIIRKEHPGYLFNSMFMALTKSALSLASNEVASVEDIDRSWMGVSKMKIGPLGMLDLVGLDTAMTISRHWGTVLNDPVNLANASFLAKYVEKGHLGMKTGKGFYEYPNPIFQDPRFLDPEGSDENKKE